MVDYTSRLGLPRLAVSGAEMQNDYPVLQRQFADIADTNAGARVCTSTTRPGTPYIGQIIYETDTGAAYIWTGGKWDKILAGENPDGIVKPTYRGNYVHELNFYQPPRFFKRDRHIYFTGGSIGLSVSAAFAANTWYQFADAPVGYRPVEVPGDSGGDIAGTGAIQFGSTIAPVMWVLNTAGAFAWRTGVSGTLGIISSANRIFLSSQFYYGG